MALPKFPTQAQVEDALEELAEHREFFEAVTQTDVPVTLKEALERKWELIASGVVVEHFLAYRKEQRELDRQRVIPLPVALALIEDWETQLIKDHVLNPAAVTWKVFGLLPRIVEVVWSNKDQIWKVLKTIFNLIFEPSVEAYRRALLLVWGGVGAFLSAVCLALKPGPFEVVILSILKDRDRVSKLMRRRALPQGRGRVRRRKVARV